MLALRRTLLAAFALIMALMVTLLSVACDKDSGAEITANSSTPVTAGSTSGVAATGGANLERLIRAMGKPYPDGDPRYLSSNAYDYTKDNPAFDAIVAMGYDALPGLEKSLTEMGLRDYLACIAIEKITRCDLKQLKQFAWDDAGRFLVQWNWYLEQMPLVVEKIVTSGDPPQAKARQIAELGAPAVPYVVEHAESVDEQDGSEMTETLATLLLDAKPALTVDEFGNLNADTIGKLKAYVEDR
jgi:hypothetical protein